MAAAPALAASHGAHPPAASSPILDGQDPPPLAPFPSLPSASSSSTSPLSSPLTTPAAAAESQPSPASSTASSMRARARAAAFGLPAPLIALPRAAASASAAADEEDRRAVERHLRKKRRGRARLFAPEWGKPPAKEKRRGSEGGPPVGEGDRAEPDRSLLHRRGSKASLLPASPRTNSAPLRSLSIAPPPSLPPPPPPPPAADPTASPTSAASFAPTHPTQLLRRPRRRSTLTAATDIPWTPPLSPLTPAGEEHSKVGLKVRRALSLLAHGDGHQHHVDPADPRAGTGPAPDGLSRRESKRREKVESSASAARSAAFAASSGGDGEGSDGAFFQQHQQPAGGVQLREVPHDSPRDAYYGRRESLLRSLRALSTGPFRAGSQSGVRALAGETIGEEEEADEGEGEDDNDSAVGGAELGRLDSRHTHRSTRSAGASSSAGGGPADGNSNKLSRLLTPAEADGASPRWTGRSLNPFANSPPARSTGGAPAAGSARRPPLASVSPRPSLRAMTAPAEAAAGGSLSPVASRDGGQAPVPERLAMTALGPTSSSFSSKRAGRSTSPSSPTQPAHSRARAPDDPQQQSTLVLPPIHLSTPSPERADFASSFFADEAGGGGGGGWCASQETAAPGQTFPHELRAPSPPNGRRAHSPSPSLDSLLAPLPSTISAMQPAMGTSLGAGSGSSAERRRRLLRPLNTSSSSAAPLLGPTATPRISDELENDRSVGSDGDGNGAAVSRALQAAHQARLAASVRSGLSSRAPLVNAGASSVQRSETGRLAGAETEEEEGGKQGQVVWERLWENQRGILFFGTPRFSPRLLLPNEPGNFTRPGTTKAGCRTPYNLRNYQLPDGTWEWASEWMVNMRRDGETDEKGWEYNSWFKVHGWHAVLPWHGYQGWVRRREWIRLRVLRPRDFSATTEAGATSRAGLSRTNTPLSPLASRLGELTDSAVSSDDDDSDGDGNGGGDARSDVSAPFMHAATLQRWHYEPLTLDEACALLNKLTWDAERLRMWRAWLGEGEDGVLGLRGLVEDHFAQLAATFSTPVSRLRLQDLLREQHPTWRFTPPSW